MLNQSEEPAGSSTVPRPELNPLLNPLLAENMKRWAEVYFSAAPEQRDQAVRALLEELREKNSTAPPADRQAPSFPEPHNGTSVTSQPESIPCVQCGQENPRQYQFCGNCGGELKPQDAAPLSPGADERGTDGWQRWDDPQYAEDADAERLATGRFYPSPSYHGLSILQSGSEAESDGPDFAYEAGSSHRYRFLLALFLAIVIGGLGYKAWKATQDTEKSYTPPPPPVSAPDSNPPANTPQGASTAQKGDADAAAKAVPATKTDANEPPQRKAQDVETTPKDKTAGTAGENTGAAQPATGSGKASASAQAVSGAGAANGSEELSIAQQYLNGANGRRNGAQAAPWLWKSVSKHNGEATLLLADLYLKGDGVSKNCDQARILLDSAARKGVSGAGERLRHLTAFGCQ